MSTSDYITNARPAPRQVISTFSGPVRPRPYVASTGGSQLTFKERLARKQSREVVSSCGGSLSGYGIGGDTTLSSQGNFFSPQLSTDFLELPQSRRERLEIYRHFYNADELVGQAIDLHTEIPLSKVRLSPPKPRTCPEGFDTPHNYSRYILSRFERMCDRMHLFQNLFTIIRHYWLDGTCLPGDEWVSVSGGIKKAEDVKPGDLVLTHKGRWRPVTTVVELPSSPLVQLDISRIPGSLRLTLDHPVEVLTKEGPKFVEAGRIQVGDYVRISWPENTEDLEYCDFSDGPIRTLATGGYSLVRRQSRLRTKEASRAREYLLSWLSSLEKPTLRSRESIAKEVGVPVYTLHNVLLTLQNELPFPFKERVPSGSPGDPHTLWLPIPAFSGGSTYSIEREWIFSNAVTRVPVNEDLLYVLGYWLGDGSLVRGTRTTEWGRGAWTICGGDPSLGYLSRVEECLVRLLGRDSVVRSVQKAGTRLLYVIKVRGNPAFVEWWAFNFGETSHGPNPKRVPAWVLSLPSEKQLYFLGGLIDSDGCITKNPGGVQIGITSLNVVSAARDVMLRLGAIPSLSRGVEEGTWCSIDGRWSQHRYPSYVLGVFTPEARILASRSCKKDRMGARHFETANNYVVREDGAYFKVNGVSDGGIEPVFNFQVSEDETFRARFVSTHNCPIFAEDSEVELPPEVGHKLERRKKAVLKEDGSAVEEEEETWVEDTDKEDQELAYYQKHYQGWARVIILPLDRVKVTSGSFTNRVRVELIPSDKDRALVEGAKNGNIADEDLARDIPQEVREHISQGGYIPLGTDPDEGSFVYLLAGRKSDNSPLGQSILDRCLRTLMYRDKLRQAQTSIASRAMTPKRIVWAEGLSDSDVDILREQVDLALVDPDYSIVANYEIRWEEMGSRDRLLDLSVEYEQTERRLLSGLGVTESLMSGETLYSGDRLKLEVINTRYLHLREVIQDYIHNYLFKPVARRMGFVEKDEWGQEVVLYPRLSFTRLPLRDSQDTFDAMMNLYQKGSISIDLILELLGIDPEETKLKIEGDMFTVNDAVFNEAMRGVYSEVGRLLAEQTNVVQKVADYLKLKMSKSDGGEEEKGRY